MISYYTTSLPRTNQVHQHLSDPTGFLNGLKMNPFFPTTCHTSTCQIELPLRTQIDQTLLERFLNCPGARHSLLFYRRRLLLDIATYLNVKIPSFFQEDDEEETLQHELSSILIRSNDSVRKADTKRASRTDWNKSMTAWIRNNAEGADRKIFRLVACDGFRTMVTSVQDLKEYLPNVIEISQSKSIVKKHTRAVRRMYDWFDNETSVSALTGLDSACFVFLSLIRLFKMTLGMNLDDQVRVVMDSCEISTQSFLQRRAATRFKDVLGVDYKKLDKLGEIYTNSFPEWEGYVEELLNQLVTMLRSKEDCRFTRSKAPRKK